MREASWAARKLQITPEAQRLLLARLGADRALSRAEIEKLALYAQRQGQDRGERRGGRRRRCRRTRHSTGS